VVLVLVFWDKIEVKYEVAVVSLCWQVLFGSRLTFFIKKKGCYFSEGVVFVMFCLLLNRNLDERMLSGKVRTKTVEADA
jgi:hypothetical protein